MTFIYAKIAFFSFGTKSFCEINPAWEARAIKRNAVRKWLEPKQPGTINNHCQSELPKYAVTLKNHISSYASKSQDAYFI